MTTGVLDPRTDMLIDMTQPVNLLHPLNLGLVAWWLALAGTMGGRRFMDIVSPGPNGKHGTLTNMDPARDWVGGPPGLWGALDFDGDDHIVAQQLTDLGKFTLIAVGLKRSSGLQTCIAIGNSVGTENAFFIRPGRDVGFTSATSVFHNTDLSVGSLNAPHSWVGTYDQITLDTFLDGKPDNSSAETAVPQELTNPATIGRLGDFNGRFWDGQMSSVRVLRRGYSDSEVALEYQLSLQGYPGMLNRLPPISSGMIAAASLLPSNLPVYGQRRAAIGDPPVYGATIVRS